MQKKNRLNEPPTSGFLLYANITLVKILRFCVTKQSKTSESCVQARTTLRQYFYKRKKVLERSGVPR